MFARLGISRSAPKVRPVVLAAAAAVAIVGADALFDGTSGTAAASSRPAAVRVGDTVRYRNDGLAYEVIGIDTRTALIRRGDLEVYADRSDILFGR